MMRPTHYLFLLHLVGWLFFLSLPLFFIAAQGGQDLSAIWQIPLFWLYFSIYPAIFYLHTYLLFPKLYLTRRYGLYSLCILLLATAVFFLQPFDRSLSGMDRPAGQPHSAIFNNDPGRQLPPPPRPGPLPDQQPEGSPPPPLSRPAPAAAMSRNRPMLDIVSILFFVLTLGLSITAQSTRRWRIATRMAAQAETDKVNAELSFLKAQINPHFLFNTLNNIYTLAVTRDDHTADSILKLSNIMRYITDEVSGNFVPLRDEAACIADYIDLQRLRLSKKAQIHYTTTGDLSTQLVAPLVLMTFVENVFKYGISSHQPSPVTISLAAETNCILFSCQNRIFPASEIKSSTGIGISNTRKRLTFLYPGKHQLLIETAGETFQVMLTLQT